MMAKAMNLTQLIMFSLITFWCRRRQKMAKEMNFTQLIKWVNLITSQLLSTVPKEFQHLSCYHL
uniref:Putative ovule protein n=1 Tax=Solanum chacoense TaxID=4108 RepID=A0A0V0GIT3_SOLCH